MKIRSLSCLWAISELGISIRQKAKRLEMSPGVGFSVERGKAIAHENEYHLIRLSFLLFYQRPVFWDNISQEITRFALAAAFWFLIFDRKLDCAIRFSHVLRTARGHQQVFQGFHYSKLGDKDKNLIIPESPSKYPLEDAAFFLCTSINQNLCW